MEEETIVVDEDTNKPIISEVLCSGCGICVHKCPFEAITIVNLPQELETPIHQFGPNTFRLYRLPIPRESQVLGLLGANGVGKTTAIRILSGEITPNLGEYQSEEEHDLSTYFRGSELQTYFERMQSGNLKVIMKPQQITRIPTVIKGTVAVVVEKMDERAVSEELIKALDMEAALPKKTQSLSGGELQRLALIVAMSREADVYYFDEPSSYLDINQRLNVSKAIRKLSEEKSVIVVEHDLALLDYLSDYVHVLYGQPGVYGICSVPYGVRVGINSYLRGYLKEENVRFRREEIVFDTAGKIWKGKEILLGYPALSKKFKEFTFQGQAGEIHTGEVIGIIGPNAIGKSTFVKILAGVLEAEDEFVTTLKISYKPQYIESEYEGTVQEVLFQVNKGLLTSLQMTEIVKPLNLEQLMEIEDRWVGTASELLGALEGRAEELHINPHAKGWPGNASALSKRLKVVETDLAHAGILVTRDRESRRREILIAKQPATSSSKGQRVDSYDSSDSSQNLLSSGEPSIHAGYDGNDRNDGRFTALGDKERKESIYTPPKEAKSPVVLKDFYIYHANYVEPKEYDSCRSDLSENSLMGSKVLAQKGYGGTHGYKYNTEPSYEQ